MAQPNFTFDSCSPGTGNYTANSPYKRNLNATLSLIVSNDVVNYGFYNESFGREPDRVNALALCRGDVPVDVCRSCLRNATRKILQVCPNQKEVLGRYEECMIRYSNISIFGIMQTQPALHAWTVENVTDNVNEFRKGLKDLLTDLRDKAASGDWRRKFATGNVSASFQRIYALVQCTPDLNKQECTDCLDDSIRQIPRCCDGKRGGRLLTPSCNIRFEDVRFADPTPELPPLVSPPAPSSEVSTFSPEGNGGNTTRTIISIVVPIVSVFVLTLIGMYIFLRRRKQKGNFETVDEIHGAESLQFDFNTVRTVTNNFSDANKLGQGGFGAVYKGTLPDGQEIAVKRLWRGSGQGDFEFKNEVLLVAKLQHRNLVRILGFCLEGNERLLVYEFVPNASLDHFIFDKMERSKLDWERRYKIIGGVARGVLYLHEDSRLRIIHRDLKASNILLDADMNPKIADFGMARLFEMDETQGNTSRIVGTYGYMAPEYAMHGQFSVKSDVFSFGVLVLEIVAGQRNNCFRNGEHVEDLISSAWKKWSEGTTLDIVDPVLTTGSRTEIMRCIHIALLCVQENVANRPTMATVVLMLSSFSLTLPVPSQPAFFMHSTISNFSSSSASYYSRATESGHTKSEVLPLSVNEASITELDPR